MSMVAAGCALCLLACAGAGDGAADAGGTGTAGRTAGAGTTGSAGMTGGAGTTAAAGNGGSTRGGAGASGGGGGAGAWDCLDVPGTLCICYARAGTDAPTCSAGFRCCFQLNATSCECFVAEEDCTAAAAQYTPVADDFVWEPLLYTIHQPYLLHWKLVNVGGVAYAPSGGPSIVMVHRA